MAGIDREIAANPAYENDFRKLTQGVLQEISGEIAKSVSYTGAPQAPVKPFTPFEQDISDIVTPVGKAMRGIGSGIASGAQNIAHYFTGVGGPGAWAGGPDRQLEPAAIPSPAASPVPALAVPGGVNATPKPEPSAEQSPAKPHKWDKYANIFEHLADMPDKEFVSYVDRHPNVSGLGYVKGENGKIERVIQNPTDRHEGGQPPITLKQYESMQRDRQLGIEEKRMNIENENKDMTRKMYEETKTAAQKSKDQQDFEKRVDLESPKVGVTPSGKDIPIREVGMLDIYDSGRGLDKAGDMLSEIQSLAAKREEIIKEEILKKGVQYKAEDINKPGTPTYKIREEFKKKYRDAILEAARIRSRE
jgi:hypothetical protein